MSSVDTRPPPFRLRLSQFLDIPRRFCNPPEHSAAKVRSCSVVPVYKVALDDVLNRRHLPPLGLKDFEEWLLFVERCPQNLYFLLWLKEYSSRYRAWQQKARRRTSTAPGLSRTRPISSSLSIFYTRAKQTFFSSHSPYSLPLPPSVLKPYLQPPIDSPYDSPHPDPAVFSRLESDLRTLLQGSVQRLVRASFTNVSTYRAICGILGGSFIFLMSGALPFLLTLFFAHSRWARFAALPGFIAGTTIVLASFHGLCVGIYLFGDARQLHDFELVRPQISRPAPVALSPLVHPQETPQKPPPIHIPTSSSSQRYRPSGSPTNQSRLSVNSEGSQGGTYTSSADSASELGMEIYISPAMDPDTGELSPNSIDETYGDESKPPLSTAAFIKGFIIEDESGVIDEKKILGIDGEKELEAQTLLEPFDFSGLPQFGHIMTTTKADGTKEKPHSIPSSVPHSAPRQTTTTTAPSTALPTNNNTTAPDSNEEATSTGHTEDPPHRYQNVPPFGPLTRILNPLVVRAHWEIFIRSAIIGTVICLGVMAGLLAIPEIG